MMEAALAQREATRIPARRDGSTAVYRMFSADGQLLYVGISASPQRRFVDHGRAGWWTQVARIDIERFATRAEALAAERAAILAEHPVHNVVWNAPPAGDLRQLRIDAGLSQAELASRARCSTRSIVLYEGGKMAPAVDRAMRIADALGCSLQRLADAWPALPPRKNARKRAEAN